jgi:hypothetical protein
MHMTNGQDMILPPGGAGTSIAGIYTDEINAIELTTKEPR